jgi:tagaturonate reductase
MAFLQKTAEIARNTNRFLERMIPVTTPLGIVLGFLFSGVFINFLPFVPLLFGLMTFSGALKLTVGEFKETVKSPVPILLYFAASHVIMPVCAMAVSSQFFDNIDIVTGFVLLFAGPTAVSGFIWVTIFKGDKALGLTLILLDTLLAPLIVPASVSVLMGAKTTMDMTAIAISLFFMIVIPTITGVTVNETSRGKIPSFICPYFDPFAKICLMLVIAANASAISPDIHFDDPYIWITAVLVILLTTAGFLLLKITAAAGKCRSPKDITIIISGGLRNNSAVMTIAVAFFPKPAVLPTLVSIIVQQTIAAIMGKIFAKK